MATVYRAEQERLGREIALKVLHDFVAADQDYRERFVREAKAAARLNQQNLVRAYEAGCHEGTWFFAMEFVRGEDLAERLGRVRTLGEPEALAIAVQVARALEAAEEHGIVHRDVKPENILLGDDGVVKLADLGLAKAYGDASITAEGFTLGTVAYFSPEQCKGSKDLDARSDFFSLGSTLFTMLTGQPPFGRGEDNPPLTMKRILQEPLDLEPVECSPAVRDVLSRLLAKRPDERPEDCGELVELLEDTLARLLEGDDSSTPIREQLVRERRRRPRRRRRVPRTTAGRSQASMAPLAAGVVGVCVALVAFLAWRGVPALTGEDPRSAPHESGSVAPAASPTSATPAGAGR
jgi:eukaryotic-like serine/threonine-protein kinase